MIVDGSICSSFFGEFLSCCFIASFKSGVWDCWVFWLFLRFSLVSSQFLWCTLHKCFFKFSLFNSTLHSGHIDLSFSCFLLAFELLLLFCEDELFWLTFAFFWSVLSFSSDFFVLLWLSSKNVLSFSFGSSSSSVSTKEVALFLIFSKIVSNLSSSFSGDLIFSSS